MNPYDNNPFTTDTTRDTRSEHDANRLLRSAVTPTPRSTPATPFPHQKSDIGFWHWVYNHTFG